MWRFRESGKAVWQSRFLSLLSQRNTVVALLFIIGISAYLLVSIYTSSAFDGGNGTPSNPYIISTCTQLQEIDDQDAYLYASYILANDIDCSLIVPFESIGNYQAFDGNYKPFAGRFDGDGHTISNVTVGSTTTPFTGVFSTLYGASVRNLNLDNIVVNSSGISGTLAGRADNAGIIGVSVTNSSVTIHGTTVSAAGGIVGSMSGSYGYALSVASTTVSTTNTNLTSAYYSIGGLAGLVSGFSTIDRSTVRATVSGNVSGVGGLAGTIGYGSTIKNSYSQSTVTGFSGTGGIVGGFDTSGIDSYIDSVYFNGTTTATSPTGRVGGINGGRVGNSSSVLEVSNSFVTGRIGSTTNSGGISGFTFSPTSLSKNNVYYPTGTGQTRCTPTGSYSAGECTSNNTSAYYNSSANAPLSSWDFANIWSETGGARPTLDVFPFTEPGSAIAIGTCSDLAVNVRSNPVGWFELSSNINCAGDSSLLPLTGNTATSSAFHGIFDGQGYTVSGITVSKSASQQFQYGLGLFSRMYGATVRDVTLTGGGITALSLPVDRVGALAGTGMGIVVENVTSSVPVTTGEQFGGGLIGYGSGYFDTVAVTANLDSFTPDPFWLGGVIGYGYVLQLNNVTYNGTIDGYWYSGGLVGYTDVALLSNATSSGTILSNVQIGGLLGIVGETLSFRSSIDNGNSSMVLSPNTAIDNYFEGAGGLIGFAERTDIINSSYTGTIDMGVGYGNYVGGLVASLSPNFDSGTSTISNSFVNGFILADGNNGNDPYLENIGGMVGEAGFVEIVNSSASTTMRFGSDPASNNINSFYSIGGLIGSASRLLYATNVTTEGSISIYEDIAGNSGGYGYGLGGFGGYLETAYLENATSSVDIYLKSYSPSAIGGFVGDLENSTVTNIFTDGSVVVDSAVSPTSIGGLAGYAYSLIVASSTVNSDLTITNAWGPEDVGGFIGYLDYYNTIVQSYTDSRIVLETGLDGVSGPENIGGFFGRVDEFNTISDTYASTSITINAQALNQAYGGGNIGGYAGYVGSSGGNSISNSYSSGAISIVSDISTPLRHIGGFIGLSDAINSPNTYTNNFTVSSISPIASSTSVGGFIGHYGFEIFSGVQIFTNNYYDQTRTQQSVCSGIDAIDPAWCSAQNIAAADPDYFYTATNQPMSSWNFTSLWLEHPDTYPTFGVSAPMGSTPPTVTTTDPATSITQTGATVAGNITSLGSGTITARGFIYGLTPLLGATTTANSAGFSTGSFNMGLTGLVCNTTYYFAAYASGTDGSDYGSTESFTTSACAPGATPPTVSTTASASSITQTSATLSGNISSLGSATITTRGFAHGLTTALGATTTENSAGFSTGGYTAGITSLICNTTYYFRAYATGADGTGYGTTQTFTTTACATPPSSNDGGTSATRVKPKAETQAGVLKKTDSITICHQAGNEKYVSNTNVQVFIDLAESGYIATLRGHDGHTGDIVPSFTYDLGEGIKTYEGNNWTSSNKILHANNCELFLKPDVPPKQPAVVVPSSVAVPGAVVKPGEETLPTCDIRSVYTQVSTTLSDSVVAKATVPAGAVKSKKVESNGKSNYALTLEVKPINSKKAETYTEKFTGILLKYQENTDNENVPFGIEKKLKAVPYTPPQSDTVKQTNTVTTANVVRVESKPPCTVETVVTENRTVEPIVVLPPVVAPQTESEEVVIVSDILELTDVLEWDLTEVKMPIPPFEVSVSDELGNVITEFAEPFVIEIAHPSILGSEQSIQVMQPSSDGLTWYEVPFEVDGDTIRITIQNPGEFFIWFLPRTASASDEAAASSTGLIPWLTIEFPRWLLGVASTIGFGAGLGMLLLQLSRMPIALEHLSHNLSAGLNNLIGLLTFRKRRRPWGTVYDSVTKAPVDPAYVELFDQAGMKQAEAITDLDGRYGFLVPQGMYSMMVRKTNYTFPSKLVTLNGQDVIYHNLYFGGAFNVSDTVVHDVPMDPQGYDWNQHEKLRTNQTRFFHRLDPLFVRLLDLLFYLGFIAMVRQFVTSVNGTTGALLGLYTVLLIGRFMSGKPVLYGTVTKAGKPLSYGVLRILQEDKELLSKVIDGYGRYVALVPNGTYTMVIEEHVIDSEYRVVLEKKVRANQGLINGRVRIP